MQSLYEFRISELCNNHSVTELAEMLLVEREINISLIEANNELREENETLKYLIARERINREVKQNDTERTDN